MNLNQHSFADLTAIRCYLGEVMQGELDKKRRSQKRINKIQILRMLIDDEMTVRIEKMLIEIKIK
jgi:hypothetical protein